MSFREEREDPRAARERYSFSETAQADGLLAGDFQSRLGRLLTWENN